MILVPPSKIDDYTARGWWGTQTLWDVFVKNVRELGDQEAVVDASNRSEFARGVAQRLSWRQLGDAVDRLAVVLIEHNIRRDDPGGHASQLR